MTDQPSDFSRQDSPSKDIRYSWRGFPEGPELYNRAVPSFLSSRYGQVFTMVQDLLHQGSYVGRNSEEHNQLLQVNNDRLHDKARVYLALQREPGLGDIKDSHSAIILEHLDKTWSLLVTLIFIMGMRTS